MVKNQCFSTLSTELSTVFHEVFNLFNIVFNITVSINAKNRLFKALKMRSEYEYTLLIGGHNT